MAISTARPHRHWVRRRAEVAGAQDDRLSFMDQAGFQLLRATGRAQLMNLVWIYEHSVDYVELARFHQNFGSGLAGRRIERSPLPFGRHRWVSALGAQTAIEVAERARPRTEVSEWLDERAARPVDPERGPGWHLGVLPLTDGATAISLVGSHLLGDGVAALLTVVEAATKSPRNLGYAPPRARPRARALLTDLRDTAKGLPEVARTVSVASRLARERGGEQRTPQPRQRSRIDGDTTVVVPAVSAFIDLGQWDRRATALNGNGYSLLAGFATRLAKHMGRLNPDGTVTLQVALNDREGLHDTRAQAMVFAQVFVDPAPVTSDLTDARTAIREALKTARDAPDATLQLLPLVPLVPRRALQRVAERFLSGHHQAVSCSNLGDIPEPVACADGTAAEYVMLRGVDQNVRRSDLERAGGQLVVVTGRIGGRQSVSVVAYQPGEQNSKQRLRELITRTLADFDMTGEII